MHKLLAILFCFALLASCSRPTRVVVEFPQTPTGQMLQRAYKGDDAVRRAALIELQDLPDDDKRSLLPTLGVIVERDARMRNWPMLCLYTHWSGQLTPAEQMTKAEFAAKLRHWLPVVLASVSNPNPSAYDSKPQDLVFEERMPGFYAAALLGAFTAKELRPHLTTISDAFNAPARGEMDGESHDTWHRHFLAGVLIMMKADGVAGLVRGLDHPHRVIREQSLDALSNLATDRVGQRYVVDGPDTIPLDTVRTAKEQATIRRALRSHFPRFVQALEIETEDSALRDAVTIVESIAEPALVTPRLLTALSKIEARMADKEFYANARVRLSKLREQQSTPSR